MRTPTEILEEMRETLLPLENTLKTMFLHNNIKPESKEKIQKNLSAITFFHAKVEKLGFFNLQDKPQRDDALKTI